MPMERRSPEVETVLERFRDREAASAGSGRPAWLAALRAQGISHFADEGFPRRKNEDWKYTSVGPVAAVPFRPAPALGASEAAEAAAAIQVGATIEVVFVNGHFVAGLSSRDETPGGIRVEPFSEVLRREDDLLGRHLSASPGEGQGTFPALNSAFFADGVLIHVPAGQRIVESIHLAFFSSPGDEPTVSAPRVLIVAGSGSEVRVAESYAGSGPVGYLTNAVTEIVVGENASVDHLRVQEESAEAFHVGTVAVSQGRSARFSSRVISLGASLSRTGVATRLEGEGAECSLDGLYLARGRQHVDHQTTVDHLVPHATSRELYKGILDEQATGVFNGRVFVRKDAQKSDAGQMNRNLLLSEAATINTKPQLEIFADDVKCSHGATIGRLDDEALFYLRSRGVAAEAARALLIHAFANEMIEPVALEGLRARLRRALGSRFRIDPGDGA